MDAAFVSRTPLNGGVDLRAVRSEDHHDAIRKVAGVDVYEA